MQALGLVPLKDVMKQIRDNDIIGWGLIVPDNHPLGVDVEKSNAAIVFDKKGSDINPLSYTSELLSDFIRDGLLFKGRPDGIYFIKVRGCRITIDAVHA